MTILLVIPVYKGFFVAIALVIAVAVATALTFVFMNQGQGSAASDNMGPANLDSFQITQVKEGTVVPLVYGRRRIAGNILWYGNLDTEEVTSEVGGGGKGGGGGGTETQVTGYKYYLDVWQGICLGQISIVRTYINDKKKSVVADDIIFNDGTSETDFPEEPGDYAGCCLGVAHIFYDHWALGENKTFVPTVHFVVDKELPATVSYANMDNGNNPAAIIYDILTEHGGVSADNIDLTSFNAAAEYWNDQGYGLNLCFMAQMDIAQMIKSVLQYVDGILLIGDDGKFYLKAYDPIEASTTYLEKSDFVEFQFMRGSYIGTKNDFRGTFIDEDHRYTTRTVQFKNPASIRFIGVQEQSIDLTGFRDLETASKRVFEIGKRMSFPAASVEFTTNLKFANLTQGDVVTISHSDYGISGMKFRILARDIKNITENKITFTAFQQIESLFDDNHWNSGGSLEEEIVYDLSALGNIKIFELPYHPTWGYHPIYLVCVPRKNVTTDGYVIFYSIDDNDYENRGLRIGWSQYGTLDEEYPNSTYTLDDERGILFTPGLEDPVFESISRTALFNTTRVAVCGNELMTFQNVTPEGDHSFRLTGVIRGYWHTPKETHAPGAGIWLTTISENNTFYSSPYHFFVKLVPCFGNDTGNIVDALKTEVTSVFKSWTPWLPARLKGVRTGTNLDLSIWPNSQIYTGAGTANPDSYSDIAPPFGHEGFFEVSWGATKETTVFTEYTTTIPAAETEITVKMNVNGKVSEGRTIIIGADNGTYWG